MTAAPIPETPVTDEPSVIVTSDSGEAIAVSSHRGLFERVGLQPNQSVKLTVQYPVAMAGRVILAQELDGGSIIPKKPLTIARDGKLEFKFKAGKEPGIYQVSLRDTTEEIGLHFWVVDEQNPEKNPPVKKAK